MTANKNQHFVPRCFLRPFTVNCANKAINLFNIDRIKFVENAAVKHQCSGDYFYGKDPDLDNALRATEDAYGVARQDILKPGYKLTHSDRNFLLRFWLLQFLRTDAASKRSVAMSEEMADVIGVNPSDFRYGIREAVQAAMQLFAERMNLVDDLKICLFRNQTPIPFVTSDHPAVLTNWWHLRDARTKGKSFGLNAAGNLLFLPLSPKVFCLGYDGDVYSVSHRGGWVDVRHNRDIEAFNQHQFLNCWANIYFHDSEYSEKVYDSFCSVESIRPKERHRIHYTVLDSHEGNFVRYREVDPDRAGKHRKALIRAEKVHAQPSTWPMQLKWRPKGAVFTNGTGIGYVRRASARGQEFRKELARKAK